MPPAPGSRHGGRCGVLVLAMAALAAGCSGIAPQIFSDRLLDAPAAGSACVSAPAGQPVTLECAYVDAARLQRRYVVAVRDEGNAKPQIAAGLIGLSALTLFKGITSPNTRDMAGAGVAGSAAWAYGSTMLSQQRLDVYRAGAEALMCAMAAVDPLRAGQSTLGSITDGADQPTLYGRRAAVIVARQHLEGLLRQHAALNVTREDPKPPERSCRTVLEPAPCPALNDTLSEADAALERARCGRLPPVRKQQCTTVQPPGKISRPPPPRVVDAFNAARDELAAATQQVQTAQAAIRALREAGPLLAAKTLRIQLAVSAEIDKTVPDLASVLSAAAGMRDVGFSLTGLGAFKPGAAQGGAATVAGLASGDLDALAAIERATAELGSARVALDELTSLSLGTGHEQVRQTLDECAFRVSGVRLTVTPAGDRTSVPLGGSVVFFVSGGSGVPTAMLVAGPRQAALQFRVEGGQFRFEFTPPQGSKPGDAFTVRFADGAGVAERLVEIVVAAPDAATSAAPSDESPKADTSVAAVRTPATAAAAADSGKFRDLTNDDLKLLGLAPGADEKAIQAAVDRCQAVADPPIPVTRNFDKATQSALKSGACKPGG
jgi:hypothetical protein